MSKTLLLAAACLLVAALVLTLVLRPPAPATRADTATLPPPAAQAEPDSDLAKNSPDPSLVGFVNNFRQSSITACKASLSNAPQTADRAAPDRIDGICSCAAERVLGTITVGEARTASAGVLAGTMADNPTVQALKARFAEAGKACAVAAP